LRVLVLAFDGLEYNHVHIYQPKHLVQKEYGRVEIFQPSATPVMWASFITGLTPQQHKVPLEGLPRVLLSKDIPTIFDHAEKPVYTDIPSLGPYPYWDPKYGETLREAIKKGPWSREFFEAEALGEQLYQEQREQCLEKVREGWDLFMAHFLFTDYFGHLYGNVLRMKRVIQMVDNTVREIKSKVDMSDVFLLIVSDHGIRAARKDEEWGEGLKGRGGRHSRHGFYSSNITLKLNRPKLTDFFPIIKSILESSQNMNMCGVEGWNVVYDYRGESCGED